MLLMNYLKIHLVWFVEIFEVELLSFLDLLSWTYTWIQVRVFFDQICEYCHKPLKAAGPRYFAV